MWNGDFSQGVATSPLHIFMGPADGGYTVDVTSKVAWDTIVIEETGTLDESMCSFNILDKTLLYTALRGEWRVHVTHGGETIYRGYIGRPKAEIAAIYGEQAVSCRDISSLLDRLIVKSNIIRDDIESDKARIQWLVNTIGQPLVAEGLTDWSYVSVLNGSMGTQKFPPRLTLRQAIERVLAAASDSANYYMDFGPALHTFDRNNPETSHVAPKNVNVILQPRGR